MGRFLMAVGLLLLLLAAPVQAKNKGVGDADMNLTAGNSQKAPNCGANCHAVTSSGAVISISANPAGPYTTGQTGIAINVTTSGITENDNILGIMLLNRTDPLPGVNIQGDGWVITQDPNGNPSPVNYNEKTGLASLNQVYNWTVTAPSVPGTYFIVAHARHGGTTHFNLTSAALTMQVNAPVPEFPLGPALSMLGSVFLYGVLRRRRR
jgi:hypothetical protein